MNEFLFFYHVLAVFCFILGALRLGKNALITIIAIQGVLANFFIFKQIKIFGLNVTATDVFAVGGILALNLLVEFFGKEIAKKAVWITFFTSIFCCLMGIFHILYVPSVYDINHQNYAAIFSFMPRVIISSLIVYFAVQRFDVFFYSFLRRKFKWKYPTILNVSSLYKSSLFNIKNGSFISFQALAAASAVPHGLERPGGISCIL